MNVIYSVLAILAFIIAGAGLLSMVGIMISLGYYEKEETKIQGATEQKDYASWPESTN